MSINLLSNSDSYPIVIIPKKILTNFNKAPTIKEGCKEYNFEFPVEPKRDLNKYPTEPLPHSLELIKTSKVVADGNLGGCVLILSVPLALGLIAFFFFFISNSNIFEESANIFPLIIILVLITIVISSMGIREKKDSFYREIPKDENEYQSQLMEYQNKLQKFRNDYLEKVRKYEIEKVRINDFLTENYDNLQKSIFYKQLKSTVSIHKLSKNENRGKTEIFFFTKLYAYFKNQLKIDVIPDTGLNPFQPDFVIICNVTGFHIDIEIDEPYSVKKGLPIHHDRSNDNKRNEFFDGINWGVIRFSEKQIVENPDGCIKLINDVLNAVKTQDIKDIKHNIKVENKWTYEEALIMSENNYRNTYLPSNLKVTIKYTSNNHYDDDY